MRFKRFDFVGGYGELSNSSSIIRSQQVLTTIVNGLISLNVGWQLDNTRSSSTTDYFDVKIWNNNGILDTNLFPGLFLKNTQSGCKAFIALLGSNSGWGIALNKPHVVSYESVTYPLHRGILLSIIPGNSSEEFGQEQDDNFIPPTATKVIGTISSSGSYVESYIRYNGSNINYTYFILADSERICIGGGINNNLKIGIIVGKIFGVLARNEETVQSKFGCIKLTRYINGVQSEFSEYKNSSIQIGEYGNYDIISSDTLNIYYNNVGTYYVSNDFLAMIFAANGNPIFSTTGCNIRLLPSNPLLFSIYSTSNRISGLLRWCPYEILVASNDLMSYGVVPGDGFKGYLDTDLIRCAINNYGRTYNNGEWIGFGYGLLLKWNPENTDTL